MTRAKISDLLPWWVRPWHWARHYRMLCHDYQKLVDRQTAENRVLTSKNANLMNQMRVAAQAVTPFAQVLGYEQGGGVMPEFVLVGIDRGVAGGKRIYASRELGGPAFGLIGDGANGSAYQLITKMGNLLVIDKPNYEQAMRWMGTIWRNWDAATKGKTDTATLADLVLSAPGVRPAGDTEEVDGQESQADAGDAEQGGHAKGNARQQGQHGVNSEGNRSKDS